jgi:hypothetical protein
MAGHSALSPSRRRRRPGPDPKRIAHVAKACWSCRHDAQPRPSLRHVGKSCWWKAYPPGPAACPRRRPTRCLARVVRCFATAECGCDHAGAAEARRPTRFATCAMRPQKWAGTRRTAASSRPRLPPTSHAKLPRQVWPIGTNTFCGHARRRPQKQAGPARRRVIAARLPYLNRVQVAQYVWPVGTNTICGHGLRSGGPLLGAVQAVAGEVRPVRARPRCGAPRPLSSAPGCP